MKLIGILALTAIAFIINCNAQDSRRDAAAIAKVKRLSVSKLDPKLPSRSFLPWLQSVVGRSRRIRWEVNDCGEQDGSGKQKDFPICVAAETKLRNGTHRRGLVGRPQIWWIYIKNREGTLTDVKRLGQLSAALRLEK